MKNKMLVMAGLALMTFFSVNAQGGGGGMQRMPVPERVKMIMDKLADFKLDKDKAAQADQVFTDYFKAQQNN